MITSKDLIERYRDKHGLKNWHRVALHAGIHTNTMDRVKNKGKTLDNETIIRLARELGINEVEAVASAEMQRAQGKTEREFWKKMAGYASPLTLGILGAGSALAGLLPLMPDALAALKHAAVCILC